MTADDVKAALHGRHPGGIFQGMPGPWTCIEEWMGIDLLAVSAWSSKGRYARVGYEVKVSRSDLRRELLAPSKRSRAVEWCNEFYFAVPEGLLTGDELAFDEPQLTLDDFRPDETCPGVLGTPCRPRSRSKRHMARVPVPYDFSVHPWARHHLERDSAYEFSPAWEHAICPTCNGKGHAVASRVERELPTCWVPADVGLVVVKGNGCHVVKRSPRRREVPALTPAELGQLVRWISVRPDPRHHAALAGAVA